MFRVDLTAPIAIITNWADYHSGGYVANMYTSVKTFALTVNSVLGDVATYNYRIDGNAWTTGNYPIATALPLTNLSEGAHTLLLVGGDNNNPAQWQSQANATIYKFNVDSVAPTCTLTNLPAIITKQATTDFIVVSTAPTYVYRYKKDAGSFSPWLATPANTGVNGTHIVLTGLTDGVYTIEAKATSASGLVSSVATYQWTVDTIAPTAIFVTSTQFPGSPFTPTGTNKLTSVVVKVGGTDVVAYKYQTFTDNGADAAVSGEIDIAITPSITYPSITQGTHRIEIYGKDTAGNWQVAPTVSGYWTTDLTPPTVVAVPGTSTIASGTTITITATDTPVNTGCSIYYTLNGSDPTIASTKYTAPLALTNTTTVKFFAVDAVGNASAIGTAVYTIIKAAFDATTVPPNYNTSKSFDGILVSNATGVAYYKVNFNGVSGIPAGWSSSWISITTPINLPATIAVTTNTIMIIGSTDASGTVAQPTSSPTSYSWVQDVYVPIWVSSVSISGNSIYFAGSPNPGTLGAVRYTADITATAVIWKYAMVRASAVTAGGQSGTNIDFPLICSSLNGYALATAYWTRGYFSWKKAASSDSFYISETGGYPTETTAYTAPVMSADGKYQAFILGVVTGSSSFHVYSLNLSSDYGATWVRKPTLIAMSSGTMQAPVMSDDGQVIVAAGSGGSGTTSDCEWSVSRDAGATWKLFPSSTNGTTSDERLEGVSISPDGVTIVITTGKYLTATTWGNGRVLISTDSGVSFQDKSPSETNMAYYGSATSIGGGIIVVTGCKMVSNVKTAIIQVSRDSGVTWTKAYNMVQDVYYYRVVMSGDGAIVLAATIDTTNTSPKCLLSTNSSASYASVTLPTGVTATQAIAINRGGNILAVVGDYKAAYSTDTGVTWTEKII